MSSLIDVINNHFGEDAHVAIENNNLMVTVGSRTVEIALDAKIVGEYCVGPTTDSLPKS